MRTQRAASWLHHFFDWRGAAAGLLACAALAACGGSDSTSEPPPTAPVAVAPTITSQPAAVVAAEGDSATYSVTATGTAPLAYQWKRSGVNIAGATASTYTLAAATLADNGAAFSVSVSNSAGSVTSAAAALTVNARVVPASITSSPQSVTVAELQTVTLSVSASGTAPFTYQWQRSTDGVMWNDIAGANAESYVTPQLVRTDSGAQFRAVVNNAANTPVASAAAQLTVTPDAAVLLASGGTVSGDNDKIRLDVPPGTLLGPTRFTFTPLASLPNLPADYELVPNTAYTILHEGPGFVPNMPMTVIFRSTIVVTDQAVLKSAEPRVIRMAVPPAGSAYYVCPNGKDGVIVPLEDLQQGNSSAALIGCLNTPGSNPPSGSTTVGQVRPAPAVRPTITQQPVNVAVATPQPVTFSVVATGQTPLSYQWQRNGLTVEGATSASYTIAAPTASDNGARFSVVVMNSVGYVVSREALLTIGEPPLHAPTDVAVDASGNLYVADTFNQLIRKLSPTGVISTLAGRVGVASQIDGVGTFAAFNYPFGVAVDGSGNVYVAEWRNHTIRKITPDGTVTTFAGSFGSNGSSDGTGAAARFSAPQGVAVDGAGNVYVADTGNQTIRKITPDGIVTTFAGLAGSFGYADGTGSAARFTTPRGIAADTAGNVYVADGTHTIRAITPAGVVTTVAGLAGSPGSDDGAGAAARFREPPGIAVDAAGNLYVADQGNHTIRKIAAGVVTTIAGLAGAAGYADGSGSAARFNGPEGIAVDTTGNVYVADRMNNAIRKITPAGVVSTVF